MNYELSDDIERISWEKLAWIFELAPLGARNPQRLETAFRNSRHFCFAWCNGELVGAGRAISDGVTHAVIFDIVVLPEHQRQGVGASIVRYIVDAARGEVPKVLLYAVPGKEPFYERLGFRRMTTAMGVFSNEPWHLENGYIV